MPALHAQCVVLPACAANLELANQAGVTVAVVVEEKVEVCGGESHDQRAGVDGECSGMIVCEAGGWGTRPHLRPALTTCA